MIVIFFALVFGLLVIVIASLATHRTFCRFVTVFPMAHIQIWVDSPLDIIVKKGFFLLN